MHGSTLMNPPFHLISRFTTLLAVFCFLGGGLAAFYGSILVIRYVSFRAHSRVVEGVVIDHELRTSMQTYSENNPYSFLDKKSRNITFDRQNPGVQKETTFSHDIVEFSDQSGKKHRFTVDFGINPDSYVFHKRVSVRFDPNNPENTRMESFLSIWLTPLFLLITGFSVILLGVSVLKFPFTLKTDFFQSKFPQP